MRYFSAFVLALICILAPEVRAADITLASGVTVAPQASAVLPVTLSTPAGAGGVFVTLSSSDASRVTVNPSSLFIPAGATTPYIQPQVMGLNFGTANISAAAFGLSGDTQTVRVAASLFGPASTTVTRGTTQNITFVLSAPAPAALTLILRSDNPAIASVPASATILGNGTSAIVPVTGAGSGSTVIRISAAGITERTLNVMVIAPGSITLPVVTAPLGQTVPFPVRLGTPAPSGGVTLTLTSSKSTTVRVSPASLFIQAGTTVPSSQPQVTGVNIGAATITSTAPGYSPASQSVPVPATISVSPTSLTIAQPGTSQKLLLALSHSAPWGQDENLWGEGAGVTVQLSSSNPNVAAVPATVDLYPDRSSFTTVVVLVRGIAPGTAVIRASAPPFIPEITATVTVGGTGTRVPASLTATGGTFQSADVNSTFAAPLAVTVSDAGGNPVSGVIVTFTPPAIGPGGSFAGGVNTALTNAAGVATSATFTANSVAGAYAVLASVSGLSAPAIFQMANTASSSGAISLPVSVSVGPNQTVTFPVSLTKSAPPGGVTVTLSSSDPSRASITPASVFIAAGATTATVQPRVGGVNFGSANISASAPGYSAAIESVRVAAALAFAPSSVTIQGTNTENLTLTLSAPAPAGGLIVSLKSDRTNIATVPSIVTFGANATSVTVSVTGSGVGAAVIAATTTAPNITSANAAVTVTTRSDVTLASGITAAPQASTVLPVTLSNPAGTGGVFVTLSSSDTSRVTVNPSSIYIPAGATAPYIQPQVTGLNFGTANVTAAAFGLAGDTEVVRVEASLFGPAGATVTRGTTQNITFVLSAPAPAALTLALRSDNPTIAGVPSSATIPANGTNGIVPVTGAGAGSTVIRISAPGITERTLNVTVMAPGSITVPVVTVPLGQTVPFSVRLGTPAPSGGVTLTLTSSKATTVRVSPASVFISAGATAPSSQPQVTGINIGAATITATAPGYSPASQFVPVPATISFSPTSLTITQPGTSQKILLALSHSAPWGQDGNLWGDGARVTVQLSSSNPNVAAVPATVDLYPDGSSFTTVVVLVRGIAPGTAVIRASAPPFIPEITATVTVLP